MDFITRFAIGWGVGCVFVIFILGLCRMLWGVASDFASFAVTGRGARHTEDGVLEQLVSLLLLIVVPLIFGGMLAFGGLSQ